MSFSWDFIVATALVLALLGGFIIAFQSTTRVFSENAEFTLKQERILLKADWVLKTCFPEGIAFCDETYTYSHEAHPQAQLTQLVEKSLTKERHCIKRIVLQNGVEKILVVCDED